MQFKLVDKNLGNAKTFCNGGINEIIPSTGFKWNKVNNPKQVNKNDILFFTDQASYDVVIYDCKLKILILSEPKEINQNLFDIPYINFITDNFDYVFTHDPQLFVFEGVVKYYHGGTWIKPSEMNIYDKNKHISFISSNKNISSGHKIRHTIYNEFGNLFDVYGSINNNKIDSKLYGLQDYKYSIIIENCKQENYFTEKLIDCFLTGTIPIYWGAPIAHIFDKRGYFTFNTLDQLKLILDKLDNIDYNTLKPYILKNFNIAKNYITFEDFLFYWVKINWGYFRKNIK